MPNVTKALIQREQAASPAAGCVGYYGVRLPFQAFIRNRVDKVPETAEFVTQFSGQVLVEFYAHPPPTRGSVALRGPERPHTQSRHGYARP